MSMADCKLMPAQSGPLVQYGCGPVQFSGMDNTFYERRLTFEVIEPSAATLRDQIEILALSVRDVLSQRWVLKTRTYEEQNPKRIYYLSMEYLLGRSLANNVMNLLLQAVARGSRSASIFALNRNNETTTQSKNVTENDTAANDDSTNAPHLILVPRARTRSWVGGDRALLETPGASQLHVADTWLPNVAVLQHDGVVESQTRGHSEWFP